MENWTPRFELISEKKLVGMRLSMSFTDYKVASLWQNFMPNRKSICNTVSNDLIAMTIYKPDHFSNFNPNNEFEKWAAVEVLNFENIPANMETFILPEGLYAVFDYNGSNTDNSIYQYIFNQWLPSSGYGLDYRPHLEILGTKYKNNDPNSEEEIWIPIRASV